MFNIYGGYLQSYGRYGGEYNKPIPNAEITTYNIYFTQGLNYIKLGSDNKVEIQFEFTGDFGVRGLDNFKELILTVGGESYSTLNNPDFLRVNENTLEMSIGDVTILREGAYFPSIIGYNETYDDGFDLSSGYNNQLAQPIIVCE